MSRPAVAAPTRPGHRLPALDLPDRQERLHRPASAPEAPEEISIDSDDFKPQHEEAALPGRRRTDATVTRRRRARVPAQAFHEPAARPQHEILVLRELEGRSYDEIGEPPGPLARGRREPALPRPPPAARRLRGDRHRRALPEHAGRRSTASRTAARERVSAGRLSNSPARVQALPAPRRGHGTRLPRAGPRPEPRAPCRTAGRGLPAAAGVPAPQAGGSLRRARTRHPGRGWSRAPRSRARPPQCSSRRSSPRVGPVWPRRLQAGRCRAGTCPWWATRAVRATPAAAPATRAATPPVAAQAARAEAVPRARPAALRAPDRVGVAGNAGPAGPNGPAGGGQRRSSGRPWRPTRRGRSGHRRRKDHR